MLPQGWVEAEASEVGTWGSGGTPKSTEATYYNGNIPWIRSGDLPDQEITKYEIQITEAGLNACAAKWVPTNSVLVALYGATIGKIGITTYPVTTNQAVAFCTPCEAINPRYLAKYFLSIREKLISLAQGGAQPNISQIILKQQIVPLPPLAEQRRIVAKLDSLTARIARTRKKMEHVSNTVSDLKKKILLFAFSGKLSNSEYHHEKCSVEVKSVFQDDQERGQWSETSLPSSWKWVEFNQFFSDVTDSKKKLPANLYMDSGEFPVIDQGKSIIGGYTDRKDLIHTASDPVIIFGDHTRSVKLIHPPFVQGADGVKVLSPSENVCVDYAYYAMLAIEIPDKGYSRHMKFVRRAMWPLPPLPEQNNIVRKINHVFARANLIEKEAKRALSLLERLESALLAKAFRGELVPQDPDDEPASVLLDRVRAERAAAPKPKRGRRQSIQDMPLPRKRQTEKHG
ncbi:restriction endonuclease subunit S [Komagataeibacter melaceti]|nr:restriction endonuclease subunit S [Komagataeibacter melaceti]